MKYEWDYETIWITILYLLDILKIVKKLYKIKNAIFWQITSNIFKIRIKHGWSEFGRKILIFWFLMYFKVLILMYFK